MRKLSLALALFLASAAHAQSTINVEWTWAREHRCSTTSPALKLSAIPGGTKTIRVKLVDNDATAFQHGGGEIEVSGADVLTVPAGALKAYTGPCPPNFGSFGHDYTFNVTALGADGKDVLGTGTATRNFSARSVPQ